MQKGRLLILTILLSFSILGATAGVYAEQPSITSLPPRVKLPNTEPAGVYADWVAKAKFEDLP